VHFIRAIMQTKSDLAQAKLRDRQNFHGYTMMEILAVLSLVGILSAMAMPSLLAMQGGNNLNNSLEKVRSTLEISQTIAVQKNTSCTLYIPDGSQIFSTCLNIADRLSSGIISVPNGLPQVDLDKDVTIRTVNWSNTRGAGLTNYPSQIFYNSKGLSQTNGTIVLDSSSTSNKKCLVFNAGIGLIRNGRYVDNVCEVSE
jgi:prepilin-type N-terminal cleavage/methylation domain-containing protein